MFQPEDIHLRIGQVGIYNFKIEIEMKELFDNCCGKILTYEWKII